jgi:hypothetical protein
MLDYYILVSNQKIFTEYCEFFALTKIFADLIKESLQLHSIIRFTVQLI